MGQSHIVQCLCLKSVRHRKENSLKPIINPVDSACLPAVISTLSCRVPNLHKMSRSTGKSNRSTLTVTEALSQLLEAAETVELRQSVKPHEENRITSAFHLAGQPECVPKTKTEQRQEHYKRLLKKVLTDSGPESVVACALGLGQTAIGNMREAYRLRLPGEIMRKKEKFRSPYVRELVRRFGGNGKHSTVFDILRLIPVTLQLRITNNQHKSFTQVRLHIISHRKITPFHY